MKKLMTVLAAVTMVLVLSTVAQATLSWQTNPILGTGVSYIDGHVVVVTDTGLVTIPHYSMTDIPALSSGAPGVGSSMTVFTINPDTLVEGHLTDTVTEIAAGSGIFVDPGQTYNYTRVWTYLGSLQPSYSITSNEGVYYAPTVEEGGEGFVMLMGNIENMWPEDVGQWQLVETWTNIETKDSITSGPIAFTVIPEPATICVLGFGALALLRRKK